MSIFVFAEEKVKIGEEPFDDIHVLTGSLKLFFRELPEPLFPSDLYNNFVEAISKCVLAYLCLPFFLLQYICPSF